MDVMINNEISDCGFCGVCCSNDRYIDLDLWVSVTTTPLGLDVSPGRPGVHLRDLLRVTGFDNPKHACG